MVPHSSVRQSPELPLFKMEMKLSQHGYRLLLPHSGMLGLKSLLLICPGQMVNGPEWVLVILKWLCLLNCLLEILHFVFKSPFETMT